MNADVKAPVMSTVEKLSASEVTSNVTLARSEL